MNFLKFTVLTTLGAAIWNATLIGAGYILGENWHLVDDYVGILSESSSSQSSLSCCGGWSAACAKLRVDWEDDCL